MQNTEENLMYAEIDNFDFHTCVSFGFDSEHVESTVIELLCEQFDDLLIEDNFDELSDEISRQFELAKRDIELAH